MGKKTFFPSHLKNLPFFKSQFLNHNNKVFMNVSPQSESFSLAILVPEDQAGYPLPASCATHQTSVIRVEITSPVHKTELPYVKWRYNGCTPSKY